MAERVYPPLVMPDGVGRHQVTVWSNGIGWRTLLADPPGTGGSAPASRLFTMEECAEAAIQILDAASVDRAAVLGLS